jgi:hypothetical protein
MTRIGLISDTHGFLDEAVFKHFEICDEVWHVGDFGEGVANRLNLAVGGVRRLYEGCSATLMNRISVPFFLNN